MTHPGVVYLDVELAASLVNFMFDYLLLWATAEITRMRPRRGRLAAGAALGALYYLLLRLALARVLPMYGLLRWWPVAATVPLLMLAVCFGFGPRGLFRSAGYFYGLGLLAGGAGVSAQFLVFGRSGVLTPAAGLLGLLVSSFSVLILAELGWGAVDRRVHESLSSVHLRIDIEGNSVETTALLDTGNHLVDPLGGRPVIIVSEQRFESILPEDVRGGVKRLAAGDLRGVEALGGPSGWQSRFRMIPFSSIGKEKGLLVGFRPDKVWVQAGHHWFEVPESVVALAPAMADQNYDALVNPRVVRQAVQGSGSRGPGSRDQHRQGRGGTWSAVDSGVEV